MGGLAAGRACEGDLSVEGHGELAVADDEDDEQQERGGEDDAEDEER